MKSTGSVYTRVGWPSSLGDCLGYLVPGRVGCVTKSAAVRGRVGEIAELPDFPVQRRRYSAHPEGWFCSEGEIVLKITMTESDMDYFNGSIIKCTLICHGCCHAN